MSEQKSGASKILIGCGIAALVGILLVAGCSWWAWNKFGINVNPVEVKSVAETEIVPGSQIPDSLIGVLSMKIDTFQMTTFRATDASHFLFLAASPEVDRAQMESQLRTQANQQTGGGEQEDLGTETLEVGGEDVEFTKTRIKQKKQTMLQYMGVLPAREGRVVIVQFIGPETSYDLDTLQSFLASVPAAGGAPTEAPTDTPPEDGD